MQDKMGFIAKNKIIPVIKLDRLEDTLPVLESLKAGGINIAEITFRTAVAADALTLAKEKVKDMLIGAGTIINAEQAMKAINAGAEFIVSPGFSCEVADICKMTNMPYFGGCVTPTEIMQALEKGCKIIKFFPSENFGGVKTLKSLSAAFPQVKFMPTGGISLGNIKEYLAFDKVVACGGSWMVKDSIIKAGDFAEITRLSREVTEAIQ